MEGYTPKIGGDRKKTVQQLTKLLTSSPVIAVVNLENLPTRQLQKIRANTRDKIQLFMTKKRLMKLALKDADKAVKNIGQLKDYLRGMPALLFTKDNPFTLFKMLQTNKSNAPAKAGQTAPFDIYVDEGPTPFQPGPIIGELGAIGIKTAVENGKIAIKERSLVVKEGEVIKQNVAELLTRLGVEPMEVGLNLTAAFENGEILERKVLDFDEKEYTDRLTACASQSFHLMVNLGMVTEGTVGAIIGKAVRDARNLALAEDIITSDNIDSIIGKAVRTAAMLQQATSEEV
ncbi:MAG: 50S ribosomal protein L10 [DPANN group archaeon]|nr:50S ribosomal protein L10 [DPANN group archaeon]